MDENQIPIGPEIKEEEIRLGKGAVEFLLLKEHKLRALKLKLQKELQYKKQRIQTRYRSRIDKLTRDIKHVMKSARYMVDTNVYQAMKKEFLDKIRVEKAIEKEAKAKERESLLKELDEEERLEQIEEEKQLEEAEKEAETPEEVEELIEQEKESKDLNTSNTQPPPPNEEGVFHAN